MTGLVLAGCAGVFSVLSWDRADQVAGVVSALVGIAGLGAAAWAALAGAGGRTVGVSGTGAATARGGGSANTGLIGVPGSGSTEIGQTGDAHAEGGGSRANTGFEQP
ncbi:hypothetical protein [Streptomyces sp. BPTC-684]|uniref:hypothetical protein n=1 Tax=Streptomyces sp. BPTC-684 TaxID=3043734 RepID=UPI0024B114E8|nr:hypothetical protein [Streptomyces sp. BPTC-684]WHM35817.1 hypothetical protein QIY60_02115 [Streptomyces sp. BPTC-684]